MTSVREPHQGYSSTDSGSVFLMELYGLPSCLSLPTFNHSDADEAASLALCLHTMTQTRQQASSQHVEVEIVLYLVLANNYTMKSQEYFQSFL